MEAARDEVTSKLADTVATHEKVRAALLVQLQELQSEQRANLKKMEEQERLKKMEDQERATEHLVRATKLQQPRPVSIAPKYKLAYRQEPRLSSILCTEETSQLTCKKCCRARRRRRRRATRQTLEAVEVLEAVQAVCGGHTQLSEQRKHRVRWQACLHLASALHLASSTEIRKTDARNAMGPMGEGCR
jgi:cell envelope opacity-associated protein A